MSVVEDSWPDGPGSAAVVDGADADVAEADAAELDGAELDGADVGADAVEFFGDPAVGFADPDELPRTGANALGGGGEGRVLPEPLRTLAGL